MTPRSPIRGAEVGAVNLGSSADLQDACYSFTKRYMQEKGVNVQKLFWQLEVAATAKHWIRNSVSLGR